MAIRFYIRTTIGSSYYYSYLNKKFAIKDPDPIMTYSAKNTLAASVALAGNDQTVISGYNSFNFSINATPQKESTIVSYKISGLGINITSSSGTVNNITTGTITFEVTDSRGNNAYEVLSLPICDYFNPTINLGESSFTADGNISVAVSGRFYNNSFGATSNALTLQYRLRTSGGSWGSWTTATATSSGSNYSATITKSGLNYQNNYDIEVKVADEVTYKTATKQLLSLPVFEWDKNSFNFNVPVEIDGDLTVNGNLIAGGDYILEQGISGSWTYRKWNSGIYECWARLAVAATVNTVWGNLYVSGALSATNISFPITFTAVPMLTVNLSGSGAGGFLLASGSGSTSTTKTGIYEIARGNASSTSSNYAINYHAIGRWK